MTKILFFGDSITYGAWDSKGGWVSRFRSEIDKKNLENNTYDIVLNLGVSGNTSKDLVQRFEAELLARISEEENIIYIAIGVNDSQYIFKQNKTKVTISDFQVNLYKLIELSQKYSNKIILIGILPVNDDILDPIPWSPESAYRNSVIEEFNNKIKEVSSKTGTSFVNLYEKWISLNYKNLLLDGIHPNSEGHELLSKQIISEYFTYSKY